MRQYGYTEFVELGLFGAVVGPEADHRDTGHGQRFPDRKGSLPEIKWVDPKSAANTFAAADELVLPVEFSLMPLMARVRDGCCLKRRSLSNFIGI
jgi:hypothetical protein